ncbi:MAG: radical SAM protein, partial [Thermodesulfobacteriota bacterium]|nr:radical SAM protein [Thermodesulfobacteriota bacterium]
DGDALIIPQKRLVPLLKEIRKQLPQITRVGTYANVKSIKTKSLEDLRELKDLGLGIIYMGLESGDDETLEKVRKEGDRASMTLQAKKVLTAGIKLNVTVMLGLAELKRSNIHAIQTGEALSEIDPHHVAALTFIPIPGTPLFKDWQAGDFILPDPMQMLSELRTILKHTHLSKGLFLSNHASNYLPLRVRLPRGKEAGLKLLDKALAGEIPLTPEMMRAL